MLCALIVVLLTLAGVMIVMSLGPDPGDKMILMGLPLLAMPQMVLSVLLLALVSWMGRWMRKAERWFFSIFGLSFLCLFVVGFLLG